MDFQSEGRYDQMYQKAKKLRRISTKTIRTFGNENNHGNIVTAIDKPLGYGKNVYNIYMTQKIAQKKLQKED